MVPTIVEAKWDVALPVVFGNRASYVRSESYGFTERDNVDAFIEGGVLHIVTQEATYMVPMSRVQFIVCKSMEIKGDE